MNIYYDGEAEPETHYQEFNSNTNKRQTVSLSVMPNYSDKAVDHVAFAFVYGYNKVYSVNDSPLFNKKLIYSKYREHDAVIKWIDDKNVEINGVVLNLEKDEVFIGK